MNNKEENKKPEKLDIISSLDLFSESLRKNCSKCKNFYVYNKDYPCKLCSNGEYYE